VTVFSDRPADVAEQWVAQGATALHVVDLDGAYSGVPANLKTIGDIVAAVNVPVEVGGGIRSPEAAEALLSLGVARIVLGTAAVEDRSLVARLAVRWCGQVAVSLDARGGEVMTRGWRQASNVRAKDLAEDVVRSGAAAIIYTDIERDGTLTEPNYTATTELVAAVPVPIIASGGISQIEHLQRLQAAGVSGAIVGRALYTGAIRLADALTVLGDAS
jgi:phosphoribosylformimino-5-aminoimidazole carboxamide ribotide isomerase